VTGLLGQTSVIMTKNPSNTMCMFKKWCSHIRYSKQQQAQSMKRVIAVNIINYNQSLFTNSLLPKYNFKKFPRKLDVSLYKKVHLPLSWYTLKVSHHNSEIVTVLHISLCDNNTPPLPTS
jgi:hypothetical protein